MRALLLIALGVVVASHHTAHAWGERGHELITHVAVRLVDQQAGEDRRLADFLIRYEGALTHLANVPDNVWRANPVTRGASKTLHFIDLDHLITEKKNLPVDFSAAQTRAAENKHDLFKDVGVAPWYAAQLTTQLECVLHTSQSKPGNILKIAGILSHFVGDLAQPFHVTSDYDGWSSGQGGVHRYLETEVVNHLPIAAHAHVFELAQKTKPADALFQGPKKPECREWVKALMGLAKDSFSALDDFKTQDQTHAVLAASISEPKHAAKRKHPRDINVEVHGILYARMALAADTLARLWVGAWQRAGSPDLSKIDEFPAEYVTDFIPFESGVISVYKDSCKRQIICKE